MDKMKLHLTENTIRVKIQKMGSVENRATNIRNKVHSGVFFKPFVGIFVLCLVPKESIFLTAIYGLYFSHHYKLHFLRDLCLVIKWSRL